MINFPILATVSFGFFLLTGLAALGHAQADPDNCPPQVSISWPKPSDRFRSGTLIKIKADVTDPDGSVAQVQFLANTELIGVVTNPPFNLVWQVILPGINNGPLDLMAAAVDNLGATTESETVHTWYYTG